MPTRTTLVVLALVAIGWAGCRGDELASSGRRADGARPPIVLVTADGLRADAVESLGGLPGLTPHLDRFLGDAEVSGRAIAASTDPVAAGLSAMTGLLPSQHGAVHREAPTLPAERETLAEALSGLGYRTVAFAGSGWLSPEHGHAAGFDAWHALGPGRDAVAYLRELPAEPVFVWVDLDVPAPPLRSYGALRPRLSRLGDLVSSDGLPERVGSGEIEAALAGERPLDEDTRRRWFALYALNVARADVRFGELLEALAASPAGQSAVVALASSYGARVGDLPRGGTSDRGVLRRQWLEVPLGLELGATRSPSASRFEPGLLAVARIHATLVEIAGGTAVPAAAPSLSLYRENALSEVWSPDGGHEVSWLSAPRDRTGEEAATVQVTWRGYADVPPVTGTQLEVAGETWEPRGERGLEATRAEALGAELRRRWLLAMGDAKPWWPQALDR